MCRRSILYYSACRKSLRNIGKKGWRPQISCGWDGTKTYCHQHGAQIYGLATMNFMGLDLVFIQIFWTKITPFSVGPRNKRGLFRCVAILKRENFADVVLLT
ncbi:hypothetical protein TNCV_1931891 [Trichonephila clavipes]|nr:hypothetical protein TNCV_1931891 [Trichonephila clavipes]